MPLNHLCALDPSASSKRAWIFGSNRTPYVVLFPPLQHSPKRASSLQLEPTVLRFIEIRIQGRTDYRTNLIEPAARSPTVAISFRPCVHAIVVFSGPDRLCNIPCHRTNYKLTKAHGEGLAASQYFRRPIGYLANFI